MMPALSCEARTRKGCCRSYSRITSASTVCDWFCVLQDPRRYFEQAVNSDAGPVSSDAVVEDQGASVLDMLQSINPHALQSGMTPASARQVLLLKLVSAS